VIKPRQLSADIELRLFTPDDGAALADAYRRSGRHLARWEPDRPAEWLTDEYQRDRIVAMEERYHSGRGVTWMLADGERVAGQIGLNDIIGGCLRSADVGYWLTPEYVGRGLMTVAVEAVAEIADTEFKLHRLAASTQVANEASQSVLRRTGFTQYGTATEYLYIGGAWQDSHLFQRILHNRPLDA
jgi:ribosomal-protein-alanine N-acetyltransferase